MNVTKTKNPNLKKEQEANRFATELLSPTKEVRKLISANHDPSLEQIVSIHKNSRLAKKLPFVGTSNALIMKLELF